MMLVDAFPLMYLGHPAGLGSGSPDIAYSFVDEGFSTVEHSRLVSAVMKRG